MCSMCSMCLRLWDFHVFSTMYDVAHSIDNRACALLKCCMVWQLMERPRSGKTDHLFQWPADYFNYKGLQVWWLVAAMAAHCCLPFTLHG
jgi:hypothetical protein